MPIIKSAKKRVRIAKKATLRNRNTKRSLKSTLKVFTTKITSDNQSKAQSALDIAVKKGVIHKNKAARHKKRLAAAAKAAGVKPTTKKTTAKKAPAAKKTSPAQTSQRKVSAGKAKKSPAKKTAKK